MIELRLPFPPSVNDMYLKGRVISPAYKAWREHAGLTLNRQVARPFTGRCDIRIDLDDTHQGDADNRAKPVLDLLVSHRVIGNDNKSHVRRVSIGWEHVTGCRVIITKA